MRLLVTFGVILAILAAPTAGNCSAHARASAGQARQPVLEDVEPHSTLTGARDVQMALFHRAAEKTNPSEGGTTARGSEFFPEAPAAGAIACDRNERGTAVSALRVPHLRI